MTDRQRPRFVVLRPELTWLRAGPLLLAWALVPWIIRSGEYAVLLAPLLPTWMASEVLRRATVIVRPGRVQGGTDRIWLMVSDPRQIDVGDGECSLVHRDLSGHVTLLAFSSPSVVFATRGAHADRRGAREARDRIRELLYRCG